MMYTDDTVIFYSSQQMLDIERNLNLDFVKVLMKRKLSLSFLKENLK